MCLFTKTSRSDKDKCEGMQNNLLLLCYRPISVISSVITYCLCICVFPPRFNIFADLETNNKILIKIGNNPTHKCMLCKKKYQNDLIFLVLI